MPRLIVLVLQLDRQGEMLLDGLGIEEISVRRQILRRRDVTAKDELAALFDLLRLLPVQMDGDAPILGLPQLAGRLKGSLVGIRRPPDLL